jgi:hypothetical protein
MLNCPFSKTPYSQDSAKLLTTYTFLKIYKPVLPFSLIKMGA